MEERSVGAAYLYLRPLYTKMNEKVVDLDKFIDFVVEVDLLVPLRPLKGIPSISGRFGRRSTLKSIFFLFVSALRRKRI